jgi:hypothetical protein
MSQHPCARKPSPDTPWLAVPKQYVCQAIAGRLPVYRAAGWPVDEMVAEIAYLPRSRLALWRLVGATEQETLERGRPSQDSQDPIATDHPQEAVCPAPSV